MMPFTVAPGTFASPSLRAWLLSGIPCLAALLLLLCLMMMPSWKCFKGNYRVLMTLNLLCTPLGQLPHVEL